MIKSLSTLNDKEKSLVIDFLNRNSKKLTLDDLNNELSKKIYNYGEGVLYYFKDNKVIGSICTVLELCSMMKICYIHNTLLDASINDKEIILQELINAATYVAKKNNSIKILLGIRDDEILKLANNLGFHHNYSSYTMELENIGTIEKTLTAVPVNKSNCYEFVSIYNKSFMDMPHGTFITEADINNYLNCKSLNEQHFIISNDTISIGFLTLYLDNNIGSFDIGLCNDFRGLGYGKKLLDTAISSLNKIGVSKIQLTVIEQNSLALRLYKKRGFKIVNRLSYWIEI